MRMPMADDDSAWGSDIDSIDGDGEYYDGIGYNMPQGYTLAANDQYSGSHGPRIPLIYHQPSRLRRARRPLIIAACFVVGLAAAQVLMRLSGSWSKYDSNPPSSFLQEENEATTAVRSVDQPMGRLINQPGSPLPDAYNANNPSLPDQRQSQGGQVDTVLDILRNKTGGFFINIATSDQSSSRTLQQDYGWTGVCMEPIPRYSHGSYAHECPVVRTAVASKDDDIKSNGVGATGAIAGDSSGNQPSAVLKHSSLQGKSSTKTVPMAKVFEALAIPTAIDYLSLDSEVSVAGERKGRERAWAPFVAIDDGSDGGGALVSITGG